MVGVDTIEEVDMNDVIMAAIVEEVVATIDIVGNHRLTKGVTITEGDQDLGLIHLVDTIIE